MIFFKDCTKRFSIRRFARDRSGSTAAVMALLIPISIGGLALGTEYGVFELEKRQLQNAADTAAYAAGTQLRSGLDETDMEAAALIVAEDGGFDSATGTLTLSSPPLSGAFAGDNGAVHVTLTQPVDRSFSKIFSSTAVTLVTEATVQVRNGRPACILSLNPSSDDAVAVNGSTTVALTGCDVAANSVSSAAVSSGGAAADLVTDCVSTAGGVDDPHSNFTYNDCPGAIENGPVTADPYGDIPEPDINCTSWRPSTEFTSSGTPSTPGGDPSGFNCYDNVGNLSRDVILDSNEVFVLRDSDVRLTGSRSLSGTNVTLFLTGDSSIRITGNATINITAQLVGDYAGIAIYGDRDDEIDLDLSGNTGVAIVGAIYSANTSSDITYIGNTAAFTPGQCTQVIGGGQVTFTGNSDFDTDCTNSGTRDIMVAQAIVVVE